MRSRAIRMSRTRCIVLLSFKQDVILPSHYTYASSYKINFLTSYTNQQSYMYIVAILQLRYLSYRRTIVELSRSHTRMPSQLSVLVTFESAYPRG